jgi:hypothetical protein
MAYREGPEAGARFWQRPEQLLQPEALEDALSRAAGCWPGFFPELSLRALRRKKKQLHLLQVRREPMQGGVSGAHLEHLHVQSSCEGDSRDQETSTLSLILKRMRPDESWLMRSSGDTRCREVQLWRHGLLVDMPSALCAPVLAAAYDEQAREGALLLADVSRWLGTLADCAAPAPAWQVRQYLDHLARLHAHYWQDARLTDGRYALASVEQTLLMLSPSVMAGYLAAGEPHPYIPISHAGWEAFYSAAPAEALRKLQRVFDAPAALLASAASVPATLLHGDAWPPNMGALPGTRIHTRSRTIVIDWALATAGPATFDPFWLLFAWKRVDTRRALLFYRRQLTRHLARRGIRLSAEQWQLLLDLGVTRTVMTCGESMGQAVLYAKHAAQRDKAVSSLAWWVNWAASVIQRRGWDK